MPQLPYPGVTTQDSFLLSSGVGLLGDMSLPSFPFLLLPTLNVWQVSVTPKSQTFTTLTISYPLWPRLSLKR